MTRPARHRRRRLPPPSRQQLALQALLEGAMADLVAARLASHVAGMHAGLLAWIADAEHASVLPDSFRLPGDERPGGVSVGGSVQQSRDPDDAMIDLIDRRLSNGTDPERLEPVRQRLTNRLGDLAGWYGQGSQMHLTIEEWEPLAVYLGDHLRDQVAAKALAICCLRHARMAASPDQHWQRRRNAARERWRRLAAWYIRVLDDQPTRQSPQQTPERYQSVGPDGVRRYG
jgi:hypothetical protein